jgi:lipopolysaccharide transport system ATP-binding protein
MSSPIVSVENLSKCYLVGHQSSSAERYVALRDVIGRAVKNFGRKALDMAKGKQIVQGDSVEEFWALKNVSFEVNEGEVVGIIGRNGAGKSTLLKVLSRITEPSAGRVTLRGRVASLLEVGTGFHPELTGRENIYLNGAILGMTRIEIKRKFDQIVDFAGVEKFLDTPVKRYSSGMYVRLAFAVAAHLDPEILVVDEVLAVGDAEFQKKCLGKMRDVSQQGRTVLLVSHNMSSIASLCGRAILLDQGSILADGVTADVILAHLANTTTGLEVESAETVGNTNGQLLRVWTEDAQGGRLSGFALDEPVNIVMEYRVLQELPVAPYPNFHIHDERGQYAFVTSDRNDQARMPGVYRAICQIPANLLNDGTYFIGAALTCSHNGIEVCFYEKDAIAIHMKEAAKADVYGRPRYGYAGPMPGVVRPLLDWTISEVAKDELSPRSPLQSQEPN